MAGPAIQERKAQWINIQSRASQHHTTNDNRGSENNRSEHNQNRKRKIWERANAHIRYDINDGLADVVLEVIPTEEQKTERARNQKKKGTNATRQKKKNTK
jgi:hypothetical protein